MSDKVTKEDISYEGILLDRSEDAKDAYIVIKLDSGYNVGVNIESATIELIEKGDKPKIGFEGEKIEKDPNKQNISIISTGGTSLIIKPVLFTLNSLQRIS